MKKISVVVVTFNAAKWINKCFFSLLQSKYIVSIIVVDNASTDNTLDLLAAFPKIEVIKNKENLGFGKANNIGIKYALKNNADAVFLLNQDTWIFENTIEKLVQKMELFTKWGIISPIHLSGNSSNLDANFEVYFNRKTTFDAENYIATVPFVNAAAWLIPKKCFEKVGLFESFFNHYGEDRNFCNRVLYHGYKIGIVTDSFICHDRTIIRNFKKDVLQSKYKIANTFLNINLSFLKSLLIGFKEVIGLSKYFSTFYNFKKTFEIFIILFLYYFKMLFNLKNVLKLRKKQKNHQFLL